jgi:hypothetical protein
MGKSSLLFVLLWITAAPAASMATECELVPIDKKDWQTEPVIAQKREGADAVFIGTVTNTSQQKDQCKATIVPGEVFKGSPGKEVVATQFDNRYPGANENKCSRNWLQKNKTYLFYVSNTAGGQKLPDWYFPFCSLDSYLPVDSAGKEIAIVKKLSGK